MRRRTVDGHSKGFGAHVGLLCLFMTCLSTSSMDTLQSAVEKLKQESDTADLDNYQWLQKPDSALHELGLQPLVGFVH